MSTPGRSKSEDEPFALFLEVLRSYFHGESYEPTSVAELRAFYAAPDAEQQEWARQFKEDLRQVLLGNTVGLGRWDIANATLYPQRNDREFLEDVWADLFPGTPKPHADG